MGSSLGRLAPMSMQTDSMAMAAKKHANGRVEVFYTDDAGLPSVSQMGFYTKTIDTLGGSDSRIVPPALMSSHTVLVAVPSR